MKKYFLGLVMLTVATAINAQEATAVEESIKPEAGSFSVEVGFAPFEMNAVSLQGGQLRGSYSITDKIEVRLGLGFGVDNATEDNKLDGALWTKKTTTTSKFSITPGVIYVFEGTKRLAPYVGAELSFGTESEEVKTETKSSEIIVKNDGPFFNTFGFEVLTGFNYYFAKNLFIGVEVGLGLEAKSQKTSSVETDGKEIEDKAEANEFSFGTIVNPSLRLGWAF